MSIAEFTFSLTKSFVGKMMSSAIQQLKSKKVLVIVTQAILLKHSPMKTTLEELSFVIKVMKVGFFVFYGNSGKFW